MNETSKKRKLAVEDNYRWIIPLGLALVGLSAVIIGLTLAAKEEKAKNSGERDVENYDVKNKPFIYGLAE